MKVLLPRGSFDNVLSLEKYIYISTLLGIFCGLKFEASFDIQSFDFVIISNLFLMPFIVDIWRIPRWLVGLSVYLFFSGTIGIWYGTDSVGQFLKQFLGIGISALYFYYFFKIPANTVGRVFNTYCRIAYWVCLIGFPLWLWSVFMNYDVRFRSVTTEPAEFCTLILPAYYWYTYQYFNKRKRGTEVLVFTAALVLSNSSLGFVSAAFGVVLLLSARRKLLLAVPLVVGGLLCILYFSSSNFRLRVDDTASGMMSGDVTGVNLSTYAFISNMLVTEQVLQDSPLIGHGLGSHVLSHDRYLGAVPGTDAISEGWLKTNSTDAASMTLRALSELGILGFVGILWFLVHFHVKGSGRHAAISNAILVTFFLKLLRGGLYFPPEQFFFIFIYMINYREYRDKSILEANVDDGRSASASYVSWLRWPRAKTC
jgi:hypothetical protein